MNPEIHDSKSKWILNYLVKCGVTRIVIRVYVCCPTKPEKVSKFNSYIWHGVTSFG